MLAVTNTSDQLFFLLLIYIEAINGWSNCVKSSPYARGRC